jgi:hypothetical protein
MTGHRDGGVQYLFFLLGALSKCRSSISNRLRRLHSTKFLFCFYRSSHHSILYDKGVHSAIVHVNGEAGASKGKGHPITGHKGPRGEVEV